MGSIDAACLSGFLCRLCSDMHRTVIHIYGDLGTERGIAQKINAYLPVTISRNDSLPKTICKDCMDRVEEHHDLIVRLSINIAKYRKLREVNKPAGEPSTASASNQSGSTSAIEEVPIEPKDDEGDEEPAPPEDAEIST